MSIYGKVYEVPVRIPTEIGELTHTVVVLADTSESAKIKATSDDCIVIGEPREVTETVVRVDGDHRGFLDKNPKATFARYVICNTTINYLGLKVDTVKHYEGRFLTIRFKEPIPNEALQLLLKHKVQINEDNTELYFSTICRFVWRMKSIENDLGTLKIEGNVSSTEVRSIPYDKLVEKMKNF